MPDLIVRFERPGDWAESIDIHGWETHPVTAVATIRSSVPSAH
jgi:hypothetical protein